MPDPNPAPSESSANPGDWKASFGAESAEALKSFNTPADFFKSYNDASTELKTLKEKSATFDWRKELSGEDPDVMKYIERFTDGKSFGKAAVEAQKRIRSGELARPLPENATDQERAEWRKANGIPEKPEEYFAKLPDGLVIGKDDQPLFDEIGKLMHQHNVPPAAVHAITKWYYDLADRETGAVGEADKKHAQETIQVLRDKWGGDYRANIGQVMSYLDSLGGELKQQLMDATLPDGRRLFNSPDIVEWFATKARELNPAGVIIPASGGDAGKSIVEEMNSLEKMMGNLNSEYWKGSKAESLQARYRQLVEAKQKLDARAA